jgi:hypothetical protein
MEKLARILNREKEEDSTITSFCKELQQSQKLGIEISIFIESFKETIDIKSENQDNDKMRMLWANEKLLKRILLEIREKIEKLNKLVDLKINVSIFSTSDLLNFKYLGENFYSTTAVYQGKNMVTVLLYGKFIPISVKKAKDDLFVYAKTEGGLWRSRCRKDLLGVLNQIKDMFSLYKNINRI